MKKIILYIIALLPFFSLISLLISAILIFLITLIPSKFLILPSIWILEVILELLLVSYGIRLSKLSIDKKFKKSYWVIFTILTILSIIAIVYIENRAVILLLPFLVLIYSVVFENKLQRLKNYLQRSRDALVAFNIFDVLFVTFCFLLKYIEDKNANGIDGFVNELSISQNNTELIFFIILCVTLFIVVPFFRGYLSVYFYKKQNGICKQPGIVFWNSYIKVYGISVLSICLYVSMFFQVNSINLSAGLVYLMLMSFTVYLWTIVYEGIARGGEERREVISNWILIGLIIVLLFLLNRIESDLIGILTWFLPVLLPVFIGEINVLDIQESSEETETTEISEQTLKMKRHLYWLQLICFNSLATLNILSSLFTDKESDKNNVREKITEFLIELTNTKISVIPEFLSSLVLLVLATIIGFCLSKFIIGRLQKIYLNPSKGYFEFKNNTHNALRNRKYKRNIHKRRKNNV